MSSTLKQCLSKNDNILRQLVKNNKWGQFHHWLNGLFRESFFHESVLMQATHIALKKIISLERISGGIFRWQFLAITSYWGPICVLIAVSTFTSYVQYNQIYQDVIIITIRRRFFLYSRIQDQQWMKACIW